MYAINLSDRTLEQISISFQFFRSKKYLGAVKCDSNGVANNKTFATPSEYDAHTLFGFGCIPVEKILAIYSNVPEMLTLVTKWSLFSEK